MPPTRRSAFAPLALPIVLILALSSPVRAQDCPVAEMQFNAGGIFVSDAAVFDTVVSATKELAYDAPAGTLALRHEGKFSTFVRLNDVFLLGGLVPGTPVPVVLELVADGQVSTPGCGGSNCWGYLGVRILADDASGTDSDGRNVFSGSQAAHADLGVPILFLAGVPKLIAIELNALGSADHLVTGSATFRFTALPAGATVISCHGYLQAPTPAAPATWGRVKAAYR